MIRRQLGGALLVAAVIAAGCGSSSSSSAGSGASQSGSTQSQSTQPKGAPIKVMAIAPLTIPQTGSNESVWGDVALARAEAINRAGGIHGRPLDVILCNEQDNPNMEVDCARQAIADKVVAIAGCNCPFSDNSLPVFQKAGLPVIGQLPQGKQSVTNPISFPLVSGVAGLWAAMPRLLKSRGATSYGYIYANLGVATDQTLPYIKLGAQKAGMTSTGNTVIAPTVTDFGPAIATALGKKPDGLAAFFTQGPNASFIHQLREQDPNIKLVEVSGFLSAKDIKALGPAANGILYTSQMPLISSNTPGTDLFRQDMQNYSKHVTVSDGDSVALAMWSAVWLFGQIGRAHV